MNKYCFGNWALESGQSRFPDPPERITGIIFISLNYIDSKLPAYVNFLILTSAEPIKAEPAVFNNFLNFIPIVIFKSKIVLKKGEDF